MPVYDYICHDCQKSFEEVLTLTEHDKEGIKCPHCGSKNVEQEATSVLRRNGQKELSRQRLRCSWCFSGALH